MTTIHLGVTDIPYSNVPRPVRKGKRRKPVKALDKTTGDVADILEAKYHIMRIFFELHPEVFSGALTSSLRGAIESLTMGAPVSINPLAAGVADIETAFRQFIEDREMEGIGYPGVPTGAALKGVNHRLLHPYAKDNPRRPSFRDTGLYEQSFTVWVD